MKKFTLLMLVAALVGTACSTSKKVVADSTALTANQWKIHLVYGEPTEGEEARTMGFEEDRVYGNAGCNNYFAQYTISGNKLTFTGVGATGRLCANPGTEAAILKALNEVASFKADNKSATLYDASGKVVLELTR